MNVPKHVVQAVHEALRLLPPAMDTKEARVLMYAIGLQESRFTHRAQIVDGGGKNWFFLTADNAFGHAMEGDASTVVKAKGGTVASTVRHPLNASDFSSFLLQAQNSKAQVLALANAVEAVREGAQDRPRDEIGPMAWVLAGLI